MKTVYAAIGGSRQGVKASMNIYLQETGEKFGWKPRPIVLVVPGGAYSYTSDREADPVAMQFLAMGYHAAVIRYTCAPTKYPDAMLQMATAHMYIRRHADEFGIDKDAVYSIGFSAGGHLVCSYCENWKRDFIRKTLEEDIKASAIRQNPLVTLEELRPNAMLLGYPVITSGKYAHKGSFDNLIGDASQFQSRAEYNERLEEVSLEKHVNSDMPPAFIWGTAEDGSVMPMNSVLLVQALLKAGIPVEYHLFRHGGHGLALGDRRTMSPGKEEKEVVPSITPWVSMAATWLEELQQEQ